MTNEQIFDLMNGIDPALIERADRKSKKASRPILKIAAIAAALALIVGAVSALIPALTGVPMTEDKIVWKNIFEPERWNPLSLIYAFLPQANTQEARVERHYEYADPTYENYNFGYEVEGEVGAKLGQTEVHVFETDLESGKKHDFGTHIIEFFEVDGIPAEIAVAYKFIDGENLKFYGASETYRYMWNTDYEFKSLEELYSYTEKISVSTDVRRYECSPVFRWSFEQTDRYVSKEGMVVSSGDPILGETLLSIGGELEVVGLYDAFDGDAFADMSKYIKVNATLGKLGIHAVYYITDNGYVLIEIADKMYIAHVGNDKTAQMTRDITACLELYVSEKPSKNNNSDENRTADETAIVPEMTAVTPNE